MKYDSHVAESPAQEENDVSHFDPLVWISEKAFPNLTPDDTLGATMGSVSCPRTFHRAGIEPPTIWLIDILLYRLSNRHPLDGSAITVRHTSVWTVIQFS